MKTTTYKCDKCGAEDTTNEVDLDRVGVFVGSYELNYSPWASEPKMQLTREWCRDCRYKYGLIPAIKESKTEIIPLTLEDFVREMISEEIQAAMKS
jgi:hypothetical protein